MLNFYVNYPAWISPFVIPGFTLIRWYSLMYIFAFATAYFLMHHMYKKKQGVNIFKKPDDDSNLVLIVAISLIIGARLGSCFIYSGSYYYKHPWLVFWPYQNGKFVGLPGMSFHGGVLGAIVGAYIYAKKRSLRLLDVTDMLVLCIPFGYTFGRLGNFFNAELYGRVAKNGGGMLFENAEPITIYGGKNPWAVDIAEKLGMDTAGSYVNLPRHPSQLYEALFEGIVLGAIMWFVFRPKLKNMARGVTTGAFLSIYGIFRFIIEYFRQPDESLGYIIKSANSDGNIYLFTSLLNISMGQILCFIMILLGAGLICYSTLKNKKK